MKIQQKIQLAINTLIIAFVFILNYFYQLNGFDFTLKCICSSAFALAGIINLVFILAMGMQSKRFYIGMALGLVFAMLGDVIIGYDFIIGAATFAIGHIFFAVAYCFLQKISYVDVVISGVIFAGGGSFLLFSPMLTFDEPIFKVVCIVYALIISVMLGKAIGNLIKQKSIFTATVALASALFFFSDLMLVLDWFVGKWSWTDHACMGTYYPALCFLALSMVLKAIPACSADKSFSKNKNK